MQSAPPVPTRRPGLASSGLRVLGFALLAVALIFAIGEGLARAFTRPLPIEWWQDPLLGKVRAPDIDVERWTLDTPPKSFRMRSNVMGYRGASVKSMKKPAGTKRIFFVGGSSTELPYLPEEETFAGRVEALLRAKGIVCECVNAGLTATTSASTLNVLEQRVSALEPDLVVLLDGFNDFGESTHEGWDPAGFFRRGFNKREVPSFGGWIVHASRLAGWIKDKGDEANFRDVGRMLTHKRSQPLRTPELDVCRGVPRFARNLARDAEVCKSIPCPLILMTIPTLFKPILSPEEDARLGVHPEFGLALEPALKGMAGYNDAIRDVATRTGSVLVDLDRLVPKDLIHLYDESHPTSEGCKVIADAIVDAIASNGKLSAALSQQ